MQASTSKAAYGTACQSCSQAKYRCIILGPGTACQRCLKLGKDCFPAEKKRKRQAKNTSSSSTSQLEAKIDGLVSLLTSSSNTVAQDEGTASGRIPMLAIRDDGSADSHSTPASGLTSTIAGSSCGVGTPDHDPILRQLSMEQGENILASFRTYYLIHFPFLYIPSETTVSQLRSIRPFLWLCIAAVTTKSIAKQAHLYEHIRRHVALSMVADLDRSIDQLLGLLVCIAWGNLQFKGRPFFTTFTQLALAVVYDLGLNKEPRTAPDPQHRIYHTWVTTTRNMEERRAVLGCYFMSSFVSSYLHRVDTLTWTPHIADSLQVLTSHPEWDGDAVLAAMVRSRLLCEKIRSIYGPTRLFPDIAPSKLTAPTLFYTKALEAELQELKLQIPDRIQSNGVVSTYLHYTEFSIYECYLSNEHGKIAGLESSNRLDYLYACLRAICTCFETFFSLLEERYIGFTTSTLFHQMHCLMSLYRLSTLHEPEWDTRIVAEMADAIDIGERLVRGLRNAVAAAGFERNMGEFHPFERIASTLEAEVYRWRFMIRPGEDNLAATNTHQGANVVYGDMAQFMVDIPDGFWFGDLFNPSGL
ncbi:hypothetical protein BX600DRAFT_467854 [Xylariales sp. PMI_506]|nr:hypothetical protein BX600DRAFT_467854 [Xylariales sp. PMI_506]